MKNIIAALALTALSFSAFADSRVEDKANLTSCGGKVELRSYIGNQGEERLALQFIGVQNCGTVKVEGESKKYSLVKNGQISKNENFSLSNDAIAKAKSRRGLGILITSGSGAHQDEVVVLVRQAPAPQPTEPVDYEPSEWN